MADNSFVSKPELVDGFGRVIDYLRISITDRCNLNCIYCRDRQSTPYLSHGDILRYEEIIEIIKIARDVGIKKFRITGGEPLVRKGLLCFVERLSALGVDFGLTTNGLLLPDFAQDLFNAGLRRINISLDTMRPERFSYITRGGQLSEVIDGIEKAVKIFPVVKINTVIMRGINEDEIDVFIAMALQRSLHIRFIEVMELFLGEDRFVSLAAIRKRLMEEKGWGLLKSAGTGPAINYGAPSGAGIIGFITPRSEPFCGKCNRLRLTADGKIKLCLASQQAVDIKTALRNNIPAAKIKEILREAAGQKPNNHSFKFDQIRQMSSIGG
ncbi:MAG: GTP 3',8-cyclase MoaA [Candidatus Omnitrophica bacterium]|nr:GTP 3',8-cyclase MoaA [Candidatus Omnitrophota bacterium]